MRIFVCMHVMYAQGHLIMHNFEDSFAKWFRLFGHQWIMSYRTVAHSGQPTCVAFLHTHPVCSEADPSSLQTDSQLALVRSIRITPCTNSSLQHLSCCSQCRRGIRSLSEVAGSCVLLQGGCTPQREALLPVAVRLHRKLSQQQWGSAAQLCYRFQA